MHILIMMFYDGDIMNGHATTNVDYDDDIVTGHATSTDPTLMDNPPSGICTR